MVRACSAARSPRNEVARWSHARCAHGSGVPNMGACIICRSLVHLPQPRACAYVPPLPFTPANSSRRTKSWLHPCLRRGAWWQRCESARLSDASLRA
eukprot:4925287-Pleurochrysis_carterae.AAC.1